MAATNEVATYSNGSLANSRVINANRSPQAIICVYAKFSVNVSYAKIVLYKKAVEAFIKERPREWLSLLGLRATRVEQDLGFIEYVVVLQVSQYCRMRFRRTRTGLNFSSPFVDTAPRKLAKHWCHSQQQSGGDKFQFGSWKAAGNALQCPTPAR